MIALCLLEITWQILCLTSYDDYFHFLRLVGCDYMALFHQESVAS